MSPRNKGYDGEDDDDDRKNDDNVSINGGEGNSDGEDDVDDDDDNNSNGNEDEDMYNAFVRQFRSTAHLTKVRSRYHKSAIMKVIKASGWETFNWKEMTLAMALMAMYRAVNIR